MTAALLLIFAVVVLFGPPIAVVALIRWGRRLAKREETNNVARAAYGFAAVTALVALVGYAAPFAVTSQSSGDGTGASEKARMLGEGVSEVMNASALALAVAGLASVGLAIWARKNAR